MALSRFRGGTASLGPPSIADALTAQRRMLGGRRRPPFRGIPGNKPAAEGPGGPLGAAMQGRPTDKPRTSPPSDVVGWQPQLPGGNKPVLDGLPPEVSTLPAEMPLEKPGATPPTGTEGMGGMGRRNPRVTASVAPPTQIAPVPPSPAATNAGFAGADGTMQLPPGMEQPSVTPYGTMEELSGGGLRLPPGMAQPTVTTYGSTGDPMSDPMGQAPPSGPIMAPQPQPAPFIGRGGREQQRGPGRFGGAPPPNVLARRRQQMQRLQALSGGGGLGGG